MQGRCLHFLPLSPHVTLLAEHEGYGPKFSSGLWSYGESLFLALLTNHNNHERIWLCGGP